ncbi:MULTISPECIES: hypothetical protein [unclassified Streptomyces]|uniref:hypothetical protein n=1 Tax=unclassified Streptomyces TaxID=2593676 RepID=UPI0011E73B56|nr:hypothetical protein [Streptomyces sp. sk2.1]TXS67426.1 hypothetical protein EAO76_31890 [Streptomyces sp. sk2.1]
MTTPVIRAVEADDTAWDDPSEDKLHDLLADMSLSHRFVVVNRLDAEPEGQHYMQVYLEDDLSYQVEYREGGPDRHFQAWMPRDRGDFSVEPVAKVVQDWAAGRPGWREAVVWLPWSPEESSARDHPLAPPRP